MKTNKFGKTVLLSQEVIMKDSIDTCLQKDVYCMC